jgi:hypothetical protein
MNDKRKLTLEGQEQWIAAEILRRRHALTREAQPGSPKYELIQGDIDALTLILRTVQLHRRFQEAINTVKKMPAAAEFLR